MIFRCFVLFLEIVAVGILVRSSFFFFYDAFLFLGYWVLVFRRDVIYFVFFWERIFRIFVFSFIWFFGCVLIFG